MKITFYGVRGSCPSPGKDTVKYGGNTACVLVTADDGKKLILDAGTGLRQLGNDIKHKEQDIYILLSHNHWDHIQGFPFFVPAYLREHTLHIYSGHTDLNHDDAILEQMSKSFFPVHHRHLQAQIELITNHQKQFTVNGFNITRYYINHPGGGNAYLIECDGKTLAYVTDNELNTPGKVKTTIAQWTQILQGVDLLIHDAQFMPSDMPLKSGWGHSMAKEAVELAKAANVKKLLIYSHDPERTDDEIDATIEQLNSMKLSFTVTAAQEGLTLSV
jgi:phosphoribosyl 1,2-cyclic phosphodiesterase